MTQGPSEGQDEAIRRLLAESGGPELVPPEVAARLDATLDRLVAERDDTEVDVGAEVLTIHRRRWPKLVLAAAAVVVAGYAIGAAIQNGSLSGSADSATSGTGASVRSQDEMKAGGAESSSGNTPRPAQPAAGGPVALHSARLPADVRRLLGPRDTVRLPKQDSLNGTEGFRAARCVPRHLPAHGTWLHATYDGRPAVLVISPPRRAAGEHSVVAAEVRTCNGKLLDAATVRVP